SSERTSSDVPNSSNAFRSASSSVKPADRCCWAASSKCSRSSWRTCCRIARGPPRLRHTRSRYCSSLSIRLLQDAIDGGAEFRPRFDLLREGRPPFFRDVVVAPLPARFLLFPFARDEPALLELVEARVQGALAPGERPLGVAMDRGRQLV